MITRLKKCGFILGIIALFGVVFVGTSQAESPFTVSPKHDVLQELRGKLTEVRVGDSVETFSFQTVHGKVHTLDELVKNGPVVFAFLSIQCPVSQRYALRFNRLHEAFSPKGVTIVGVSSNDEELADDVAQYAQKVGFGFPVVKDVDGEIARRMGARMTPQVFVVDRQRVLRYRGAIDDDRYENRVKQHYLQDALIALLNDQPVKVAETQAFGCTIHLPEVVASQAVTYAEHIAPILQKNCQTCHRPGEVAPFSLLTYGDAKAWATEILHYTKARLMPPWKPEPGYGDFQRERRLTDEDIAHIEQWVDGGAPTGDLTKTPSLLKFADDWPLGEPDLIVEMPEAYEVGPEGEDEYRHFIIPTSFNEDIYVQAADVQPGNRQTVHHVIIYLDTNGEARKLDAADPMPGYATSGGGPGFEASGILGGWAPGMTPIVLPEGTGYLLPKGADIVLQVHYYRTGHIEHDRSRAGLYFSKASQPKPVYIEDAINTEFTIPAGEKWYEVRGNQEVKEDIYLLAVMPHMHLLGRDMRVIATLPEDEKIDLIWIKDWDFNWQDTYHYKKPIFMPQGSRVEFIAHFDNSVDNPRNPHHPPKPVGWGKKTTDEMAITFLHYVKASEFPPQLSSIRQ